MDPKERDRLAREIAEHLARAASALARGVERVATEVDREIERDRAQDRSAGPVPAWAQGVVRIGEAIEARAKQADEARRQRRAARRARKHQERLDGASAGAGVALVAAALVLVGAAFRTDLHLWWLLILAAWLGLRGARQFSLVAERRRRAPGEPAKDRAPAAADPLQARVEVACEALLASLKGSPESLRAFLGNPEALVSQLRDTARRISQRTQAVRALIDPVATRRLAEERAALASRVAAAADDVVRQRLGGALAALDQQIAQRGALAGTADRLEAEHLRLAYTLEGLLTQVQRMRAAEATGDESAAASMARGVEDLRSEVAALADALHEVNAATPVAAEDDAGGAGRTRTRG